VRDAIRTLDFPPPPHHYFPIERNREVRGGKEKNERERERGREREKEREAEKDASPRLDFVRGIG
jgi:hypothetical protein